MPSCAKSVCRCHREPPNMIKALGWMQSSSYAPKADVQGAHCDGHQAGGKAGRDSQGPFTGFVHQTPWKCHFPLHAAAERQFGDTTMGFGNWRENSALCSEQEETEPTWQFMELRPCFPNKESPKSYSHWRCCLCTSNAHMLVWEFFYSPTF